MIYYLVAQRHEYTMRDFLATWGKALADRVRILRYEDIFSGVALRLPAGTYVFTSIGSGMGSRNPPSPARKLAIDLHRNLVLSCGPDRVLNDPGKFLSRFELLRALGERGINRFTACRVGDAGAPQRFPVFLRAEHGTLRDAPRLLRTREEYAAAVRGAGSVKGLLAVEFSDTAGAPGLYRKYACFIVGDRVVPRHLFFSRSWLVKGADLTAAAMVGEELAFLESNPHAALLREVCRMANIAYGRIDYAVLEGRPQVWEINITPALVSNPAADAPARQAVHRKFVELFSKALDRIDPPPLPRLPQVEIRKMRPGEIGRVIEILAHWNMAPLASRADVLEAEATGLGLDDTFVALAGERIVGVSSFVLRGDGWAETASLAVEPAWHGKGVGEGLQRARLAELKARGIRHVRTEADRPETIGWYLRKFGYRIAGTAPKKHRFSLERVPQWTVLVLDLGD